MNVKAKNKAGKYKKKKKKKIEMKPEILCQGLTDEFKEYFKYVRELQFTEEPNYNYLLGLFNTAMKNNNIKNDYKFDWCKSSDNTTSSEKFISTENLFGQLKLGGLSFNNKNNNINEKKENNKDEKENEKNEIKINALKEDNENEKK